MAQAGADGGLEVVEQVRLPATATTLAIALPRASGSGVSAVVPTITGFQAQAGGQVVTDTLAAPLPDGGDRLDLPAPSTDITMRYRLEGGAKRSQPAPVGRALVLLPPVTAAEVSLSGLPVVVEVMGGSIRNLVCPDLAVAEQLCGRQQGSLWTTPSIPLGRSVVIAQIDLPAARSAVTMLAALASAAAEGQDVFPLLTGVFRLLGYLGFVLVVGTTFFLTWLWPKGSVEWIFIRLFRSGAVLVLVATVLVAFFNADASLEDAFAGREGAAALARMSLVALGVAFSWEMLGDARRWRIPIVVWQLLLIETYVVDSDAWREPWQLVKVVATTGHLAATAAWLGGLLALAAILVPSAHLEVLHDVLPRFSVVAIVSVVTLVVTGALHALAVAGSLSVLLTSTYGAVLMAKIIVFAVMLLLGNVGRRYAGRLAHRKVTEIDESASDQSIRAFAVAVGAEFALATAVLATTAALVHVAPVG